MVSLLSQTSHYINMKRLRVSSPPQSIPKHSDVKYTVRLNGQREFFLLGVILVIGTVRDRTKKGNPERCSRTLRQSKRHLQVLELANDMQLPCCSSKQLQTLWKPDKLGRATHMYV